MEYAILETSGQVTVIPKPNKRPTTPEDFNIEPKYEGIPYDLVVDGKVEYENLKKIGKDYIWLKKQTEKLVIKENISLITLISKERIKMEYEEEQVSTGNISNNMHMK